MFYNALGNKVEVQSDLVGNGDFRSQECVELLKECDIVVTNPPFSLFREYILQLIEYGKKFLIIGNPNSAVSKNIFPLFKENKVWCGMNNPREFRTNDSDKMSLIYTQWYTNLENKKRNEFLNLYRIYNGTDYPKYDNIDAINVDKLKDIPCDYFGTMGVPLSIIASYNPKQFRLLDVDCYYNKNKWPNKRAYLNGNKKYVRIIIERIK